MFLPGPGSIAEGIENESGTYINVSLEDNTLGTSCKQLDIRGLGIEQLNHALHEILDTICSHAEVSNDEEHYIEGHRSGTFRMRVLAPPAAASQFIGQRGQSVKALSRKHFSIVNVSKTRFSTELGAVVRHGGKCWPVPDSEAASNQIVEVIGDLENVEAVLLDLNQHVQDHAGETWYISWAGVEGFEDLAPTEVPVPDEDAEEGEQDAEEAEPPQWPSLMKEKQELLAKEELMEPVLEEELMEPVLEPWETDAQQALGLDMNQEMTATNNAGMQNASETKLLPSGVENPEELADWLMSLDGGTGALMIYLQGLTENFDTVEQISLMHTGPNGEVPNPEFFEDLGVKKRAHKVLFTRWFEQQAAVSR